MNCIAHTDVESVYGSPISEGTIVDLNTFSWFYTFTDVTDANPRPCTDTMCDDNACDDRGADCCAPDASGPGAVRPCKHGKVAVNLTGSCFGHPGARFSCVAANVDRAAVRARDAASVLPTVQLATDSACHRVCETGLSTPTYDGTLWVGRGSAASAAFASIGFFVRRDAAFVEPAVMAACTRLEVSHLLTHYKGGERGISWFFHTVGSGVFIDCHQLPVAGRVASYRNRRDFEAIEHAKWVNDEDFPGQWMRQHSVSMIILTQADFKKYQFSGDNPRTEILVAHKDSWTKEKDHGGPHGGVCLQGQINIPTFAGWDGQRACDCNPLERDHDSFLHCG